MTDLFKINFKNEDVIRIQNKIKEFNWSKISSSKTWEMGTNPVKLKELCEYWTDEYDWFTDQDYLNSFKQYKSDVDDLKIHFVLEKGKSLFATESVGKIRLSCGHSPIPISEIS